MSKPTSVSVVVADDSAFMRRLLTDALKKHGFNVLAAVENGDRALTACRELSPDVLTLDLAMPGLDGIGVLRGLQQTDLHVSVVVVSAFSAAQGAHAVDALAEGAVELVAKPATGESLHEFVADLGAKVKLAAASRHRPRSVGAERPTAPIAPSRSRTARAVVIACSTGGPQALNGAPAEAPRAVGCRDADRPAHAGRVHGFARVATRQRLTTARAGGRDR